MLRNDCAGTHDAHEAANSSHPGALEGLELVEIPGPDSTPLGSIAVSFTGMLAARMGASVRCMDSVHRIRMETWPPLAPDGSSALFRFLNTAKQTVPVSFRAAPGTYLLTDDARIAAAWPDQRTVLISPAAEPDHRWQSEISAMAASGLLDIVGEAGRPPLPLPGNQMAYATGLAALAGLLASYYADLGERPPSSVQADVIDVVTWLNWKNRMPAVSGNRQTGRARREEWRCLPCRDGYIAVIFRDRDIPNVAKLMRSERLLDDIFKKEASRLEHLDEFFSIVAVSLAQRDKASILHEAGELGLQLSAVLSATEVLDDPQMTFRKFLSFDTGVPMPRLPMVCNPPRSTTATPPAPRSAS
jgi:hypothetical protein